MRPLKFRVWDGEIMKQVDLFFFEEQGIREVPGDESDFNIMQFTGLYDKHGKEVYEGDIVRATLAENPGETVEEVIEEVQIHEGHLAPFYMRVNFEEDWWKDALQDGFEIIGNVHETPELIRP